MDGWIECSDGWMNVKAVLRIAHCNQRLGRIEESKKETDNVKKTKIWKNVTSSNGK